MGAMMRKAHCRAGPSALSVCRTWKPIGSMSEGTKIVA